MRWNRLVGFADSSFTLPRSQGYRQVMMNGAAISFTSKRHTTTDESTTSAELTEAYLLACDVEGFRTKYLLRNKLCGYAEWEDALG